MTDVPASAYEKLMSNRATILTWAPEDDRGKHPLGTITLVFVVAVVAILIDWLFLVNVPAADPPVESGWNDLAALAKKSSDGLMTDAVTQLGVLFVIAVFLERAIEVFVKVWRQARRQEIEQQVGQLTRTAAEEKNPAKAGELLLWRTEAEMALTRFRNVTRHHTLATGVTLALVIALVGPRLLGTIFAFEGSAQGAFQSAMFDAADILITAGLIGGGSAFIHEIMASITDFFGESRKRLKASSGA